MFFNEYPYTNFHELNLDMILHLMKKLNAEWDEFTAVNKITNAGAWDITKQYQAWTVVSDNNIGYISLKPVPAGVAITNTEYWGVIADYDILITDLSNRISMLETFTEGYVTPEMFGAVGDGVADDTTQVQSAIDSGKAVFLVNKYRITSTLKIPMDSRITGRGYDSQIISEIDDGTPVLYCDGLLSHINISGFLINGMHKNSIGIKIDNPYDGCSLVNLLFLNMVNSSIECGTTGIVSQGLLIDNCIIWDSNTNAAAGTYHIFEFTGCNEFNIQNSKLLYDGINRGSVQNLKATNCMDMLITGCSFANTTSAAILFTGTQSRYCRLIGNTYELIDGGSNTALIELIGTVADAIQNFIIIEQPYYNCPSLVYNSNSLQHIIIGLTTTGGRRNLAITNKGGVNIYDNLNLDVDGNMLRSEVYGIKTGTTVKQTIGLNWSGDLVFTNVSTGNTVTFGQHIDCSTPGGGLKLRDSNGTAYYVIVDTGGMLQVMPA